MHDDDDSPNSKKSEPIAARAPAHRSLWGWGALVLVAVAAGVLLWTIYGQPERVADQPPADPQAPALTTPDLTTPANTSEPPSVTRVKDEGFSGSQACIDCHSDLHETYQTHPMSDSIRPASVTRRPELFAPEVARVDGERKTYQVSARDDKMVHHEMMYDGDGQLIFDQSVDIDFEVGSGRRAYTYIHQRGNKLFQSSLTWYTDSRIWDLSPGYDRDASPRFDRRIIDECISCHAGRLDVDVMPDTFQEQPFLELGIGCERCHGPGRDHIAFHGGDPGESTDAPQHDPIVNPGKLDIRLREAVCQQCHLSSFARVPRSGRTHYDFRPGQALEDNWVMLVSGNSIDIQGRTAAVGQVMQMRESQCYVGSEGKLGCISCHDPHRLPSAQEEVGFYRDRCLKCHSTDSQCAVAESERRAQQADDSCIACHMPRLTSTVPHVSLTDHRVPRRPVDAPEPAAAESVRFFDDADARLPEDEMRRGLAMGLMKHSLKINQQPPVKLAEMLFPILDRDANDLPTLSALGLLAMKHGQYGPARKYYQRVAQSAAGREVGLQGLMELEYAANNLRDVQRYAEELEPLRPWDARIPALLAEVLRQQGRFTEAIEAAEESLRRDPSQEAIRLWIADTCHAIGQPQERDRQLKILNRLKSARPPEP